MQTNINTESTWKPIKASSSSLRITNPIRDIVDKIQFHDIPSKPLISLSIGMKKKTLYYLVLNFSCAIFHLIIR